MVREAFRVLAPGGWASFTIRGSVEQNHFANIHEEVVAKYYTEDELLNLPSSKSNYDCFYKREQILDEMRKLGFQSVKFWEQPQC